VTVYLVRHGEDLAASAGRFGDEGLSPRGEAQARALARRLAPIPLRGCLVSPLLRARETARILLDRRDVSVEVVDPLAEGSAGQLEGLPRAEAKRRFPADFRLGAGLVARIAATGRTAPGGESRDAFLARARAASERIERELPREGDLLVVAHGGLLNYLLQILLGAELRDEVPFGFENCAVAALIHHGEDEGHGPFPSVRFGLPLLDDGAP
jgi:probable phosphoglycerate mutase